MDSLNLDALEAFGNKISAGRGFAATFLNLASKTGKWTAGRNASPMDGKELGADVLDTMEGFHRFRDNDGKPSYAVIRVNDGIVPPRRADLGDTDQRFWGKDGNPWKPVCVMPFFDLETRQLFVFSAGTDTGIKQIKLLVKAFVFKQRTHPGQLPVIKLGNDYFVSEGTRVYLPVFEFVRMVERPSGVTRCFPPAMPKRCASAPKITETSKLFGSAAIEQDHNGNEPPPYSDDELDELLRESDEIYGRNDDAQF
jgi:hypothetical protein